MKKQTKGAPYSRPEVEDLCINYLAAAAEERMMGTLENLRFARELERRALGYVGQGMTENRLRYSIGLALIITWQNQGDIALRMLFMHDDTNTANRALRLIVSMAELVFESGEVKLLRECLSSNPGGSHKIWQRFAKRLRQTFVEATTKAAITFALSFEATEETPGEGYTPSPQPTAPTIS